MFKKFVFKNTTKNNNKSNLGSNLERDINLTNDFYRDNKIALIFKNEVPIKVVKVDYSSRKRAKIVEAYYCLNSLPDYQGLYRGRYLCFDVKETNNKTSFPLSNIPQHQIDSLNHVKQFNGISFFIIHFKFHNKYFYLPIEFLNNYIKNCSKKSINYKIFEENLHHIDLVYVPRLNYLKIVDKYL